MALWYIVKKINQMKYLSFQKSSGQLEKTSKMKDTKKQIARLKTKLSNIVGEKNA